MFLSKVLLILLVALVSGVAAAGCGPASVAASGATLGFSLLRVPPGFRIQATVQSELPLDKAAAKEVGLAPSPDRQKIAHDLVIPLATLPAEMKDPGRFRALVDASDDGQPIMVSAKLGDVDTGNYRWLKISRDKLVDGNGREVRVVPAFPEREPVRVRVRAGAEAIATEEGLRLQPGATIEWSPEVDNPMRLQLAQPALLPLAGDPEQPVQTTVIASPHVHLGQTIKVQMFRANVDFTALKPTFCLQDWQGAATTLSGKLDPATIKGDSAIFEVMLPGRLDPNPNSLDLLRWSTPYTLSMVAHDKSRPLADTVIEGASPIKVSNKYAALIASVVLTLIPLALAGWFIGSGNPFAILRAMVKTNSGRYSLANFQILLWTMLVWFTLFYVWLVEGQFLILSGDILALLGISGGTSIMSRWVAGKRTGNVAEVEANWRNLVQSDADNFDLLRFQMLGFTLFTWTYALVNVVANAAFPVLPENMSWLLGMSSGAYVLAKKQEADAGGATGTGSGEAEKPADAAAFTPSADDIRKVQTKLNVVTTGKVDDATRAAIKQFALNRGALPPTDGSLTKLVMDTILAS